MAQCSTETFVRKAKIKHGDRYNYDKVTYIRSIDKVIITCPEHGDFEQTPVEHIRGKGCAKCKPNFKSDTLSFIEKADTVHNGKYSYTKTVYISSSAKLLITCKEHGDFEQRPNSHLKGQGCPICANSRKGTNVWRYSEWERIAQESTNFVEFSLYVIECWNEEETFIKIGKTFTSLGKRYDSKTAMPYNWKLIHKVVGDVDYISKLEHLMHTEYKESKYTPSIKFGGRYECLTIDTKSHIKDKLSQ